MAPIDLLPQLTLAIILGAAIYHDVTTRRIPNKLILLGTAAAFMLHALLPGGVGLFTEPSGGRGILFAAAGFALPLLLLLPLYALRSIGAGDVKLVAVVGAFVGPAGAVGVILLTMVCGGLLALAMSLWSGQLTPVVLNIQHMLRGLADLKVQAPATVTGKLPYAVAISFGTLLQLLLAGHPQWKLFS